MIQNKNIPKYIYVKNKIKEDIKTGKFENQLPGERVLAKNFGISYMTIRKAIDELVIEGVLYKKATSGTFISRTGVSSISTYNIGFFLEEQIVGGISSPYYSLIFKGLENELKNRGYNLIFFTDINQLNPLKMTKKFDGAIISCFPRISKKIKEGAKFSPVVLIDNGLDDDSVPFVGINNYRGIADTVEYLAGLGHKRIGFISGFLDSDIGWDRLRGFKTAVQANGLDEDKALVFEGDYSYDAGSKGAGKFLSLKNSPTAIVCANDTMAIGAIKYLREKGLDVPGDMSITGFDDIEVAAQFYPPITTVKAPISELIEKSIEILFSQFNDVNIESRKIILPPKLIIRDSCKAI